MLFITKRPQSLKALRLLYTMLSGKNIKPCFRKLGYGRYRQQGLYIFLDIIHYSSSDMSGISVSDIPSPKKFTIPASLSALKSD